MLISKVFIDRPKLSFVISIVTVLGGLLCYNTLPIAEYPEVAPPQIQVSASYPGASAQVIAETVASILEDQVNNVEDVLYFTSKSDNSGNYSLSVTFKSGINTDIAQVNVQNAVSLAEPLLPADVKSYGVSVRKRSSDILGMYVFLSDNPRISALELNNFVRMRVRDQLSRIDGVSEAMIFGTHNYSMRVWLDTFRLSSLNLKAEDVVNAIKSQNIQAAAGSVGSEGSNDYMQLKINTLGRLVTPEEFGDIVVKIGENGSLTKLRDVARIELGSEQYNANSRFNGRPSVAMALYRSDDANAIEVLNAANKRMKELEPSFPAGISWKLGYDPTDYIRTTMNEIKWTLLLTLVLVVFITYVFLQNWRATLIPTIAIPVSLIGTFIFLKAFGFSINVLTMFGLILVIGSLVDDAIVVVENCVRILDEEKLSPREAAIKSMEQITGAIIATTLVTVAIYAPIGFFGGMVGTIYLQFAVTMCIALIFSTINALTLSPALCALLLKPSGTPHRIFKPFNWVMDTSCGLYIRVCRILVRRVLLTVILFLGVLAGNYFLFQRTPSSFLPQEDKGAILCDIELPAGATLARTDEVLNKAYEIAEKIPGIKDLIMVSGFSFISGAGENVGLAIAALDNWEDRQSPELSNTAIHRKLLQEFGKIPEAKINAFLPPAIMGLGATGGVTFKFEAISGQTPEELQNDLFQLLADLNASPKTLYAFSSFRADTPQLYLDLDRSKAEAMKVPIGRVFTTLQSKLASTYVNDFNLSGYSFKVKVQSTADERSTVSDLEQISVQNDLGGMVPLSALARVKYIVGPQVLERFNLTMSAQVNVQAAEGVSSGEIMQLIESLMEKKFYPRYAIDWVDMSYQERNNEGSILYLML
ncbi:MAG: efflux RND transporter permease subunit, partial [Lentisphaeria bacterium]|nr:efflux RND transporter permease subunit [Lentisphaeria bacterium]